MVNSNIKLSQIRHDFVKSISCQFLPLIVVGWSKSLLDLLPKNIGMVFSLAASLLFLYGYIQCWKLAYRYAKYKGYSNLFGWLGIFNILGLSILFFLKNRNLSNDNAPDKIPLVNFSISAIFTCYLATEVLLIFVIFLALILTGKIENKSIEELLENKDFLAIVTVPVLTLQAWYFFHELKRAKVNLWQLIGSFRKINFKLPIGLAVLNYFFASGSSTMILYGLSFIVPKYVEGQINKVYATTPLGYTFFTIAALLFAPIMEELFYRGIIFQKLAITKDSVKALIISALIFTAVHFRSDVISLFVIGVTLAILYLKTKQIIVPIICHFVYNLIFITKLIYWNFFSNIDSSQTTIAKFHQDFIDNLEWEILFVALSAPYLCYFIYKNFPRHYELKKLPYFANHVK